MGDRVFDSEQEELDHFCDIFQVPENKKSEVLLTAHVNNESILEVCKRYGKISTGPNSYTTNYKGGSPI